LANSTCGNGRFLATVLPFILIVGGAVLQLAKPLQRIDTGFDGFRCQFFNDFGIQTRSQGLRFLPL